MPEKSEAESPKLRNRIEGLSDLVFGLALSLGAIALIEHIPTTAGQLSGDVVNFGFSFLIIVGIWLGYTRIATLLPAETRISMLLNMALLFCVALEPFLYYVQQTTTYLPFLDYSSEFYGLDLGFMFAILGAMTYMIVPNARSRKTTLNVTPLGSFKTTVAVDGIASAMFIVSTLGIFWVQIPGIGFLRFLIWYCALSIFFGVRLLRLADRKGEPQEATGPSRTGAN